MDNCENGAIRISDDVIADIAIKAVLDVRGVVGVRQRMFDGAKNLVSGKVTISKGVTLSPTEFGLDITIQVAVRYGFKLRDVCAAVQREVSDAVADMTGMEVRRVNVAVVGIVVPKRKNDR